MVDRRWIALEMIDAMNRNAKIQRQEHSTAHEVHADDIWGNGSTEDNRDQVTRYHMD